MLVERDPAKGRIYLSQGSYLKNFLTRFRMENSTGCPAPMDPKCKIHNRLEEEEATLKNQYQKAVGCLTYAATTIRPDFAYLSVIVGRFSADPSMAYWVVMK